VVGVTNPYGRIHGFLDRSRYYFFQVAPHLYREEAYPKISPHLPSLRSMVEVFLLASIRGRFKRDFYSYERETTKDRKLPHPCS
jgi:hypothetical protein